MCYLLFATFLLPVRALVEVVQDLDQFYDIVNDYNSTTPRYTIVKYYTNWCSHCKRLKPVFEELSESAELKDVEILDTTTTSGIEFKFLEVDCDMFANMLCQRLEGFPMVEVVKPLRSEFTVLGKEEESPGFFSSIWKKISRGGYDPFWVLDDNRIVTFQGRRDLGVLEQFIKKVANLDQLDRIVEDVVNDKCTESDDMCVRSRNYLLGVSDYRKELALLENEMSSREKVPTELQLKYMLLNKMYSEYEAILADEL